MRALPLLLVATALGACGGDDEAPSEPPPSTDPGVAARSDARNLATQLEACFVDTQDYAGCASQTAGSATVASADAQSYVIVARSPAGTEFRLTRAAGGTVTRTC